MSRSVFYVVVVSLVLVTWGCGDGDASQRDPLPFSALSPFRGCTVDSDCVVAQNGCCDCANGGEDVSVALSRLKEFRAQFDCREVACTELARVPACGTGTVRCIESQCTLL